MKISLRKAGTGYVSKGGRFICHKADGYWHCRDKRTARESGPRSALSGCKDFIREILTEEESRIAGEDLQGHLRLLKAEDDKIELENEFGRGATITIRADSETIGTLVRGRVLEIFP